MLSSLSSIVVSISRNKTCLSAWFWNLKVRNIQYKMQRDDGDQSFEGSLRNTIITFVRLFPLKSLIFRYDSNGCLDLDCWSEIGLLFLLEITKFSGKRPLCLSLEKIALLKIRWQMATLYLCQLSPVAQN